MIVLIIAIVVALVAFLLLGGREMIGEKLSALFPKDRIKVGDKIDVFLNGEYNRTATVTGITQDSVMIYDRLPLPVYYRGSFYATGVDRSDGSRLVYVKTRKFYKYVRAAELVKKLFAVLDDPENLVPVTEEPMVVDASVMGEESEEAGEGETEKTAQSEQEGSGNDL